jgi:hypothetical protein
MIQQRAMYSRTMPDDDPIMDQNMHQLLNKTNMNIILDGLMGIGGSFQGIKRQVREADHSPPTSAEAKKTWTSIFTPPYLVLS